MKRVIFATAVAMWLISSTAAGAEVLDFPASVLEIKEEAFYGNVALDEVHLPEGITRIETGAFAHSSVKRINLPDSIVFIADDAFDGCAIEAAITESDYCRAWCEAHNIYVDGSVISGGDTD